MIPTEVTNKLVKLEHHKLMEKIGLQPIFVKLMFAVQNPARTTCNKLANTALEHSSKS